MTPTPFLFVVRQNKWYCEVCQQAVLNRLEPIFEPIFDDASFGYRRGRSTKDALRKIWKEIQSGSEWIVDADLRDSFGSVDHDSHVLDHTFSKRCNGNSFAKVECAASGGSMVSQKKVRRKRRLSEGGML